MAKVDHIDHIIDFIDDIDHIDDMTRMVVRMGIFQTPQGKSFPQLFDWETSDPSDESLTFMITIIV